MASEKAIRIVAARWGKVGLRIATVYLFVLVAYWYSYPDVPVTILGAITESVITVPVLTLLVYSFLWILKLVRVMFWRKFNRACDQYDRENKDA